MLLVAAWSMWSLRATLLSVSYLDDASVHEQMVRFATRSFQSGRNPLTEWFPYLGEGSPQFLHYQSLGALITALAGMVVGANAAFRWSLFLLVALWPVAIYVSARVLKLGPWTAAAAAALSPFLVSATGVGYERGAYLWIGYGVWAQLWASWTLPLAWACTWRSLDDRTFLAPAALFTALTIGMHFETGYLALLAILVFPFIAPLHLLERIRRAALLLVVALLASAWAVVPLIVYGKWAAINQVLQGTSLENGYGAGRTLNWLFTGQVYDAGRFSIISLLVLIGIVATIRRWRANPLARALVVIWTMCLLLSFGRTTFGVLVTLIPGSSDLFFRRFLIGTQLAGIFLAGIGSVAAVKAVLRAAFWVADRTIDSERVRKIGRIGLVSVAAALIALAIVPAVVQVGRFDARDSAAIHDQRANEDAQAPQIASLIAFIKSSGGGRTYAGLPNNWGSAFSVGMVPVFKYLESQDVDEVGYTLRTASLMTDPEYYFDQSNPGDYTLFGVRFLILPSGMLPPTPATPVLRHGPFALWEIKANGYFDVLETVGTVREDRSDIATRSMIVLHSGLILHHEDLSVAYAGSPATAPTTPNELDKPSSLAAAGTVSYESFDLTKGSAVGIVHLSRPGVVVLSASYDPGWRVTVDGRAENTQMLAPAVVGVAVSSGNHRVVFTYRGFGYYPELAILGIVSLLVFCGLTRSRRSTKR